MKKQTQLDFWGIGAHKCGTTWLHSNLKQIPSFSLPPIKEIHYFDRSKEYSTPNKLSETFLKHRFSREYLSNFISFIKKKEYKNVLFFFKMYFSNYDDKWYLSLFKNLKGIKGEITPGYSILKKEDIRRMYELCPNAKLVIMIRNPIDRAWSHYRYSTKNMKHFSLDNLSEEEIIDFIESEKQTLRSNYIQILNNYSEIFPKDQILIGFYDAIKDQPDKLLNEVCYFLQGHSNHPPAQTQKQKNIINKSISIDCPDKVYHYLKIKYHNQIKALSDEYGGYFGQWYEDTYGKVSTNENKELLSTIILKSPPRQREFANSGSFPIEKHQKGYQLTTSTSSLI